MPRPTTFVVGQKYGHLTAIIRLLNREAFFMCDCGSWTIAYEGHVQRGRIVSCGCIHRQRTSSALSARQTKHGLFGTPTYVVWNSMNQRCNNPNTRAFPRYGGRGIKVCDEWKTFEGFLADMGTVPQGLTLERVDNDKGYSKQNCIWAPMADQANNKSTNVAIEVNGVRKNITQWAQHLKVPRGRLYDCRRSGGDLTAYITRLLE